jgi:hypothetical protein
MAIVACDITKNLSGGASNSDVNASLGGIISSTVIVDNTLNNLFAYAPGSESTAGSVKYRAFFVRNTHATLTYENAVIWISSNSTSATTEVKIALADETGSPIETIVNEDTAPVGPTFSTANGVGNALTVGSLAPGESKGIWVQWTITAGTVAVNDAMTIQVRGETQE